MGYGGFHNVHHVLLEETSSSLTIECKHNNTYYKLGYVLRVLICVLTEVTAPTTIG